ncbi:serine/threonine-protein kinase [Polyangium sp. 15x6]|uniref:serine/threonine-protein kinase n=1 Tax=Polyangium sp. 15x6 TaxID=3042687 RepID=UPI00249AA84E|nr:serine/threonine-protein kinase [Polyangium sp. 15x6]MDI3282530.1 serine/threonine-protein kinase [Polyangium sp. 15x6]
MGLGPGYSVSKHVKLVRLLGRGGMGSVWVADHLGLKTQVAVKFVSDVHAGDPATRMRFQREATSAAQIGSPHIVNIHDHGITGDGTPYMVMELLDGEDLSARIKREGPLPLDEVAKIVSQTCKALGKAHRLGIVHRDVKPSNIFLLDTEGDLFVKVLDFGIAKPGGGESSDVTSTGMIVGTILYASPEQLLNAKSVDFRADLWSLGVVAYRAMTGKLPFTDENGIGALFLAMQAGRFVPPSKIVGTIPAEVDEWCKQALAHDPAARFGSAREMANALYGALGRTSSPSLTRAPHNAGDPPSRHITRGESTAGGSMVGGSVRQEEKVTVLEHDYRTFSSTSEASGDDESLSTGASSHDVKGASPRHTEKDPSSIGGAASATTYVGEAPAHGSGRQGSGRRLAVIAAAVVSLVGAGALGFVYLKRPVTPLAGGSTPAIESDPGVTAAPASATTNDNKVPPVVTPVSSRVELAPSTPAPSASASSASAPSASAPNASAPSASAPAASPKPSAKPGGTPRSTPLPEKDYGF